MAGGRGERFWPSSREDRPKQFLSFNGKKSLLQRTVGRLQGLCGPESTWVVTRQDYADLVQAQLPDIPHEKIILEPQGRDTAACIALATAYVGRSDPDAVMIVLPADHLILQEEEFRDTVRRAVHAAWESEGLVTLGIRPTRPETGYGYIRVGARWGDGSDTYRVAAFTEKPPRERALAYLNSGEYLWNSGIFIWKVSAIRRALVRHLPGVMEALAPLGEAVGTAHEAELLSRIYPTVPKISIDYGVMEKADNVLVIPADFGWDDLGTWAALERVVPADQQGNIITGQVLAVDTAGSILQSDQGHRLLVAFGVSDLVVVDTPDVVLVADKARATDLKAVVGRLEAEGLKQHLRTPISALTDDD